MAAKAFLSECWLCRFVRNGLSQRSLASGPGLAAVGWNSSLRGAACSCTADMDYSAILSSSSSSLVFRLMRSGKTF